LECVSERTAERSSIRVPNLGEKPGFTTVSLLTSAIGVGGNTAIFSSVDSALLRPLSYADADRIVRVLEKPPGFPRNGISTLNFLDWQRQNTVFDDMAGDTIKIVE